jgi:hypothetical protein
MVLSFAPFFSNAKVVQSFFFFTECAQKKRQKGARTRTHDFQLERRPSQNIVCRIARTNFPK